MLAFVSLTKITGIIASNKELTFTNFGIKVVEASSSSRATCRPSQPEDLR